RQKAQEATPCRASTSTQVYLEADSPWHLNSPRSQYLEKSRFRKSYYMTGLQISILISVIIPHGWIFMEPRTHSNLVCFLSLWGPGLKNGTTPYPLTLFGSGNNYGRLSDVTLLGPKDRSPSSKQVIVYRVNTNNSRVVSFRHQIKAYARQAHNSGKQVFTIDLRDVINARNCPITFNIEDVNFFAHPHSDALVITVPICGIHVKRVMVDTGAYSSILMLKAFNKMGLDPADIQH
ncbi:Unknown protein, partial [Striga hermonthica]